MEMIDSKIKTTRHEWNDDNTYLYKFRYQVVTDLRQKQNGLLPIHLTQMTYTKNHQS